MLSCFLSIKKLYLISEEQANEGADPFVAGYDGWGITYDDGTIDYAVSNPNQIKLANGTNTTFDAGNNDIRFAAGGAVDKYSLLNKAIKKALRQNEAFDILDSDKTTNGGTWTEGGCYVLTVTLQKILGGTITVFVNEQNLPSHFALKIAPDTYVDGNGVASASKILKALHQYDFKSNFYIGVYKPTMPFNGIPKGSPALHQRLLNYLQPLLLNSFATGGPIALSGQQLENLTITLQQKYLA